MSSTTSKTISRSPSITNKHTSYPISNTSSGNSNQDQREYKEQLETFSTPSPITTTTTIAPPSHSRYNMEAVIYIAGWYFFSLSISIYNKWMFGLGLDFKFPILITSFHQLCLCILSSLVLYYNPKLRPRRTATMATATSTTTTTTTSATDFHESNNDVSEFVRFCRSLKMDILVFVKQIIPCSIASASDIGLSNVAISLISLSLYTMLKTSSLMFVLIFGLLFKLEKFNWRLIVICIVMTGSVIMMTKKPSGGNINDYSGLGIIMVLAASMFSGLRWSFTQILLKRNPYTPNSITTIFYVAPFMCIVLFILGLIVEGWSEFTNHPIWDNEGFWTTIGLLIIPGILAFMMTLCEFKLLTVAQVITLSIAGIFKELLTIILSSVIFGDRLSLINILGLVLTFVDILWYNYYRYHENGFKYQSLKDQDLELRKLQSNIS